MRFRCRLEFHRWKDKDTSRTKRLCFGYAGGLPGVRVKQKCDFCEKERYISLNLCMPRKYLHDEKLWLNEKLYK